MKFKNCYRNHDLMYEIFALFAFLLVPVFLYFNTFGDNGVNVNFDGLAGYDIINYYNQELLSGEFPLWNKYVEGGVVMGSFHTIGLYPFAILFSFLPINTYTFVFYFFHIIGGAYFFYLFLKELGCNRYSALVVSLIYEMSTHIGGYRKEHFTIVVGIVYLPVILYYVQKYINSGKICWLLCSSIAMGFQFLGSHTQITVYTDIAVFLYLTIYMVIKKRNFLVSLRSLTLWLLVYLGTIIGQLYLTGMAIYNIKQAEGQTESQIENLKSWSIHYIKLIMMVFPKIFGNDDIMPLGNLNSSEQDIELYLGFAVFMIICYGVMKLRKKREIKISMLFMTVAFIYAALAHIPHLAEFISKIPILNGFRCPARSLFIFIFFAYVILAIVINHLNNLEKFSDFIKSLRNMAFFWIGIMCIALFFTLLTNTVQNVLTMDFFYQLKSIFLIPFRISVVTIAIAYIYNTILTHFKPNIKYIYSIFCFTILIITTIETKPYATRSYRNLDGYLTKEPSSIEKNLAEDNYKTLDAFSQVGVQASSFVSYNHSVNNKIPAINAYVTYNNLNIYKILTGLSDVKMNNTDMFYAFPNMEQILRSRNSALSILGVKYIIDSCDILSNNSIYYDNLNDGIVIFSNMEATYELTASNMLVRSIPVKNNTLYKFEFDIQSDITQDNIIYFDMYDMNGYDGVNINFEGSNGHKNLYYYLSDSMDVSNTFYRFTTASPHAFTISNITITQVDDDEKNVSTYEPFYDDGATRIYLNRNAKDILFSTQEVVSISDNENIYTHLNDYDLLNVSYVTNYSEPYHYFTSKEIAIENIDFKTNSITATVSSKSGTFVNFSQNYHTGWKAYVDGEPISIYLVDESIMGINVPAGEHEIEFVFRLPFLYACIAISFSIVVGCIIFTFVCIYQKNNSKRKDV